MSTLAIPHNQSITFDHNDFQALQTKMYKIAELEGGHTCTIVWLGSCELPGKPEFSKEWIVGFGYEVSPELSPVMFTLNARLKVLETFSPGQAFRLTFNKQTTIKDGKKFNDIEVAHLRNKEKTRTLQAALLAHVLDIEVAHPDAWFKESGHTLAVHPAFVAHAKNCIALEQAARVAALPEKPAPEKTEPRASTKNR